MNKMWITAVFAALALAGCVCKPAPKMVEIPADARIVIAPDAVKAARFGAQELQHHLKQITGREFPIATGPVSGFAIRVGAPERSYAPQEYEIEIKPSGILLAGRDKADRGKFTLAYDDNGATGTNWPSRFDAQGTMYAVYEFLEMLGVKWLNPADAGTVVPQRAALRVPETSGRKTPFMAYRGGTFDFQYSPLLWARNSAGEKQYRQAAYSLPNARANHDTLFLLRNRAGGDFAPANHSFYNFYDRFRDRNASGFEIDKPEYFAKGYAGQPPQLCYSNPATVAQVVKDVRGYFDNGGWRKRYQGIGRTGYIWGENYFCLETMDNGSFCKCPACSAQYEPARRGDRSEHSTYWFRFVNQVAREIAKSHPDKKLTTLAYMTHEGLPTGFRVEPNVVVYFCISCNRTPYSAGLRAQLDRMAEWRRAYPDQPLAMWLYNTFPQEIALNGNFHCFPGFFAHEADRQFKLFKKLNIRGGIFHCGFVDDIENYLNLKWMCDPDLDVETLLDGYFASFGKAAVPLRKFYDLVERRYCDKSLYPEKFGHQSVNQAWNVLGNAETMEKLDRWMAEAEKLAETPAEKQRVRLWKLGVYNYMRQGRDSYVARATAPAPRWTATRVADANGNPEAVAWSRVAPAAAGNLFVRGSDRPAPARYEARAAHDGKYLYLRLTEFVNPEKLVISPQIAAFDTWEFFVARQMAQPYRQYLAGPGGAMLANSNGEVNWRQGVPAAESGHPAFGAVCKTDRSAQDRWHAMYAFPLEKMLDVPVKPGDTIFFNLVRVVNPRLYETGGRLGIFTVTSHTTVHTIDRAGTITLDK